ncbi:MAG: tetratricopeptide repeat protein [Reyranella sp.]|nr:tetratricopeptide repeat protein [Reyranella sp.]
MNDQGMVGRLFLGLREAWRLRDHRSPLPAGGIASDVDRSVLLYLRGRSIARAGAFEMAARLYQDAVALEPRFAEALERSGEMLDVTGQESLAREKYETARKIRAGIRPGPPDRHFVLRQRGHFVAEIMAYDAVLKSLKKNTLPYLARGNAYLAAGRPEKALEDYDRALRLKRKLPEALALKGEAFSMMGRHGEAIRMFDAALAARPDDPEVLNGRGIARMAMGSVDGANDDWRRQLRLLKTNAIARACVALRMADYGSALPLLDDAVLKEPTDPYWQLYRLTALCRLGRSAAATRKFDSTAWPRPLLDFHDGRSGEAEVMAQADTAGRRAEALFQFGVVAFAGDRKAAASRWQQVVDHATPSLIEYAAARNELSRLA